MLCQRNQAQQSGLDHFFANLADRALPERVASDRAFARARDRLRPDALGAVNDRLVERMGAAGMIPTWQGLRVVAADASLLAPAVRACHRLHSAAARADQRLFALYLPGPELTLHASVHGPEVSERQMLFEALDRLGTNDVLALDRGYPASWLVAVLNAQGIRLLHALRQRQRLGRRSAGSWLRGRSNSGAISAAPARATRPTWDAQVRLVRQTASKTRIPTLVVRSESGQLD